MSKDGGVDIVFSFSGPVVKWHNAAFALLRREFDSPRVHPAKKMIKLLKKKTYLKSIENSLGANTYRNCYALVDGEEKDILKNGDLSCAFYVSSILLMAGLIKEIHTTVSGLLRDMESSGWEKTPESGEGDVLFWEEIQTADGRHGHAGFFWGGDFAVSNNSKNGEPVKHKLDFEGEATAGRKVIATYRHPKLID